MLGQDWDIELAMGLCIQDNKVNGVIKRYFRKDMKKEIITKDAQCGIQTSACV
jgi:hypothetical protein